MDSAIPKTGKRPYRAILLSLARMPRRSEQFNVGMEIDYEKSSSPNLTGLQSFVTAYRSVLPFDSSGNNHAARLTIDLGNNDQYLTALANYATTNWLTTGTPVLSTPTPWWLRRRPASRSWRRAGSSMFTGWPARYPRWRPPNSREVFGWSTARQTARHTAARSERGC